MFSIINARGRCSPHTVSKSDVCWFLSFTNWHIVWNHFCNACIYSICIHQHFCKKFQIELLDQQKGSFRFWGPINYLAWTPILAHCGGGVSANPKNPYQKKLGWSNSQWGVSGLRPKEKKNVFYASPYWLYLALPWSSIVWLWLVGWTGLDWKSLNVSLLRALLWGGNKYCIVYVAKFVWSYLKSS